MKPLDVIIDTDIGSDIDDAYALALAIRGPLNLLGVSTVSGNTITRGAIVKKMLAIENKPGIPVFAGKQSRALMVYGIWVKGNENIEVNPDLDAMVEFYWHSIERSTDGAVHIVGIGPLSNLAAIRERNPARFDEMVVLMIMGGAIYKSYYGTLHLLPEYNIAMDKQAAREIFASKVALTVVPLDVTMAMKMAARDFEFLEAKSRDDALIAGLLEMTRIFQSHWIGHRMPILHDPATLGVLLDNTLGTFTPLPLIITRGGFTRQVKRKSPGIIDKKVCLDMDKQRFFDLFYRTLVGHGPPGSPP
nr:nucleoside hydrolase [Candidatus Sigynarchaeota archaeon]